MADSIVDLGAAAVDYVGDKISDAFDYMTGAPEASASGGYYKSLGPGARQYFSGPGEEEGENFFEYLGFEEGGVAIPQEDMDQFVDFIQRNRPSYKEGETTEYRGFGSLLGMQPIDPNATIVIDGVQQQVAPQKPEFAGRADPLGIGEFFKPQEEGGFADPYFPQRPIEKQDFSGIRGFQMGTKIKLNDRDDAVGTKLMRQAGMQASASQVMDSLDPKVLAQMSRILGRDIV